MYPTMTFKAYIRKYAGITKNGMFWCDICHEWIDRQRWGHFKKLHRYKKE